MVNLLQRDKNEKHDQSSHTPYDKERTDGEDTMHDAKAPIDEATKSGAMTDAEFLLSIAGMFSSGTTDTSERVEEYVAEILKKKYS